MFWSSLFLICIAQGLFLISLILFKSKKKSLTSNLIIALLVLIVYNNLGLLIIRTSLSNYIPQVFGVQLGMTLLFGPLFYFYSKSIIDPDFHWKKIYWLHFIPYLIQLSINFRLITAPQHIWNKVLSAYLSGNLPIQTTEKIAIAFQDLHLLVYVVIIIRWLNSIKSSYGNAPYIISISARTKWLKELSYCFGLFSLTLVSIYLITLFNGKYNPITNYIYTVITSGIIYFVSYRLVLKQELIVLDFTKKYKAYKPFDNADGNEYVQKIKLLLEEQKIFTNAELKLATLADQIGLPQHQASKLINEKFGKSFNDLINEYRVEEFISRINKPEFQSYSILGVALDVGFNTKSAFNNTFKKITGKTPSEYKK